MVQNTSWLDLIFSVIWLKTSLQNIITKLMLFIQIAPNQMNKQGPYRTLQTGPAYSSGLAQTVVV